MATRHELIHIDFVANAGKANPVLQSLKDSCEKARVAKEDLDNQLASAKAANAPKKIIDEINNKLIEQTKIYTALQRGVREYAKGIDTLSKGIKEYNEGTLDQMSPKFNKALANSAKLAQSNYKSDTKEWKDLQVVIEAAQRNVTRAREDIDGLMQSMKEGASVSTTQLKTALDVLKDLSELDVVGSEGWRGLKTQMNEVAQAIETVAATERRLKGEIVDEMDAMRLSQTLTKESIAQRHAMGEAFVQAAQKERSGIEQNMKAVSDKMALERQEREELKETIKIQESYDETIEKRKKKIADAEGRKQESEKKKAQAEATIKEYDEQGKKVKELKIQKDALEAQYNKETQAAEKAAKSTKTQSEAYDEQQTKVNKLDGEIKTLGGDLEKVNADIEKMTAAQKKSAESSEKQAEAKEKEVKAAKEGTAAKKEEVKTEEVAVKTVEVEKETVESLIAANDKLKIKIQELNEERKKLAEAQKQGAAATKEEINAFKDLTKEQAQAMLDSKKATITKGGDGKISYTNADDAQRFLIESIKSVNPGGVNGGAMSLDSAGVTKVRAMFKERFGLESDDDTLAAIRGLLSGGNGSLIKGGMMNNAFSRIDIDTSKVAAYSKEIKDLTAVINGEVEAVKEDSKAVEENAEKKRTLEQVEKEIEAAEKESMQLSIRTMRLRNGQSEAIDTEAQKTDNLTESKKRNVEAMKAEIAAIKEMTAEQAKASYDAMTAKSTVGWKANKVDMSNLEEVQSFLITQMSKIGGGMGRDGKLAVAGGQIDKLLKSFQERYGYLGDPKTAKDLLKEIVKGREGGLLSTGGVADFRGDMISMKVDKEAYDLFIQKKQELLKVTNAESYARAHANETTKKGTEAIKESAKATEADADAIQKQTQEVARLQKAYEEADAIYRGKESEWKKKKSRLSSLPKTGADALLQRSQLEDEIKDYKKDEVDPARTETTRLKRLWEKQSLKLADMMGIESEPAEKTKKRTKATKEQAKATDEAAKSEMTMEQLLAKRAELEEKLTNKKKKLQEEQTKLNELQQQSIEGDKAETSSTKELLDAKTKEYDEEKAKFDQMTENKVKKKAGDTIRGAEKSIKNAEETIITTKNETMPQRMTEAELGAAKKRVAELNDEIEKDTKNFDELSQKIYAVNKRETDAAIEMAQSENVSMEKMKQAIDLLKEKIRTEATDEQTMQARGEAINRLTERYTQMNAEVVKLSKPIADRLSTEDFGKMSETEIRQGIDAANQLIKTYESGSDEAKKLADNIVRAEKHIRENGVEAARQAQQQKDAIEMMENQLSKGSALTESALKAQVRYWQQLADDPKAAAEAVKQYTANMREAQSWLDAKERVDTKTKAARLQNMDGYSVAELKEGIEAAKVMQQTFRLSDDEVKKLSEDIVAAETRINKVSVETERAAQKQRESIELMQNQLNSGAALTESALKAQVQYWQRLADDPKTAAESVKEYTANMEKAQELLKQRNEADIRDKAGRLQNMDNYSVAELKEGIEAAKQMQQTFLLTDEQVKQLSEDIVKAETRISKVSVETERAAQREREAIKQMQRQLLIIQEDFVQGRGMPSESVLKAQHNYWQKLIEDPKNAGKSMQEYRDRLKEVEELQEKMVQIKGETALQWFQNGSYKTASADQTKRLTDDLKTWRDTLNANDSRIQSIDIYLEKVGKSAKKAAEDVMSLEDALELAAKAGENYYLNNNKEGFVASPEQIQKATKAINDRRDAVIKLIQENKKLGLSTEAEEAELADLTKKLRDLKFEQDNFNMSQAKMQMLMKQPTEAVSLDELRAAIKRADGELKRMEGSMGANSKEYKNFAEQVKAAKNVLKEMEGQAKATSSAWDKAWSRLKTYVGMYMGFNILWQKMTGTMDDMMTLSDKMGEVRKTTGFTADEVGRLSDNLAKLDTRTNLTGLMEFSSLAGSIGLKTQEAVQGFTEAANMIAVSLPEMGNEASRTLMKIADATGDLEKNGGNVRETLERVGSTIIALRANSAAAAGPITDFVSRVGAVGAQAGISIDQIAALGATVDALGGRVEMSATALSRMIPAIKNNSFAVANALKIPEKELKSMTGMQQMVAVFKALNNSVKQFDMNTEEGMNGAADAVERLLSQAGPNMQEVMKTLNQQGARAGIVFGLLSQNVDTLEDQLKTAGEAYQNNTALLNEYNRMNDTAAARWERLKNQVEEMFVSDNMQYWLGELIKGLRKVIDLISMDGPIGDFFRFSLVYFALWKAKWAEAMGTALMSLGQFLTATEASTAASTADAAAKTAEAAATEGVAVANEKAAVATGKFSKALKANLIGLAVTAVVFLGMKLLEMSRNAKKAATELDTMAKAEKRAADESVNERAKLEQLYKVTQDQNKSMEERRKALHDMVGDAKYKEYQEDLLTESNLASTAAKAYGELAKQIVKAAKARVYQEEIEKLAQENVKLENANEKTQQYLDENKGQYESAQASRQAAVNQQNSMETAGALGVGSKMGYTHARNVGSTVIDEYEQKQQNIIDNQEKIKKNNETIGKMEQKLKDTGVKLGGEEGDGDGNGGGGGGGGGNLYGDYDKVKSAYSEWNGNDLVARRKEMLERVKALANGADVQAVLSEDAKFISDAVRKNIKTTEQAIEWYNEERLKIQEALKAKHLTPTGDWLDPKSKSARNAARMVKDDMKYYLDELDAYYTERKAKIQEAQNDEQISEAEARNQTLANEAEWQQRRAELQLLYTKKSEKVTAEEQQAIFDIITERTGETTKFIVANIAQTNKFIEAIGQKSVAAMKRIYGDNELDAEKSFLRQRNAIGQHMKAITDIVNKENPYTGITEELRKNLATMDALLTDIKDKEKRTVDKEIERTMFILEQSTKGYSLTWEELMGEMAKRGWKAWADAIEGDTQTQQRLMHQVYRVFEKVQDAIKKEASELKKQADIMWSNILLPGGDGKTTIKDAFEQTIGALGVQEGRVSRANSLIGAGQASERVADKLAIQQMKVQLAMQRYQYDLVRKIGKEKIDTLRKEADEAEKLNNMEDARAKRMQADNAQQALNLATKKEQTEELKQQEAIIARTEESQARLYKELREWGDLIASSLQSVMEAYNTGNADYYNERAKLDLTRKGGPGAGTYIVIDNEGTRDAKAHYEYLDERQALERTHQIEQDNAVKDAWKKLIDDLNAKMSEQITDWINASFQNIAIDNNTAATIKNTEALMAVANAMGGKDGVKLDTSFANSLGADTVGTTANIERIGYKDVTTTADMTTPATTPTTEQTSPFLPGVTPGISWVLTDEQLAAEQAQMEMRVQTQTDGIDKVSKAFDDHFHKQVKGQKDADKQTASSAQSAFAKMSLAANMYGAAYQAMTNDNLSTTQKFEMMALQAVGNYAINSLTAFMAETVARGAADEATVLGKLWSQLGWAAAPVFAIFTGLLGAAMGAATNAVSKSKSQIAQATGSSVGAGRLSTGMLAYAEGNVNEFTDPRSLTEGRSYNVDAADGKTYRAKYTGRNPSTHLTNGPEFHLAGEAGREMIIDAGTTRQITMNDNEIWRAIQTLSAGGSMSRIRRGRGVRAFKDGNVDDFEEVLDGGTAENSGGMSSEQAVSLQASIDRQNELLEYLRDNPIHAVFDVYGKGGLVDSYDTGKKTVQRHGERY